MSGLAIASLVQSGLDLHWIALSETHQVGLILIAVPFLLQTIACVFSYLARDGATGASVGVLSGSWLAQGLLHLGSPAGARSGALGLMLLAAGTLLILSASAVGVGKPAPAAVFGLAGLRFLAAGVYELGGSPSWQDAAGLIGLVVVATASYCVLAFDLEGQLHRAVLPTLRRGPARSKPGETPSAAAGPLTTEPGVRQTT